MARIADVFARLRQQRRTGLVTYVTAGDPSLERSADILMALDRGGADILEVGVAFSDPVADGPAIQRASERALAAGATLAGTIELVARVRDRVRAPIVLFSYANPLYRMGFERFAGRAAEAGVDGVLVLDLPPECGEDLRAAILAVGMDPVYLVSPTTSPSRIRMMGHLGRGFLYAISRLGVTGARSTLATGLAEFVGRIRMETDLPVAVGFGISRPEHVREIGQIAEAAVVGSALVERIAELSKSSDLMAVIERYVGWLNGAGDVLGPAEPQGGRQA